MKWAIIIVRTLLGGLFVLMSSNHFLQFMKMDQGEPSLYAAQFTEAMVQTGYFDAVKVVELTGGLMLLTGFFAVLGLAMITPVIVNIVFFHVFMDAFQGSAMVMSIVLPLMALFLIFAYRKHSGGVFHPWPTPQW